MSHVLIVGQKFSSLTQYLTEHGHTYIFLQDRTKTKFPEKKFKHRVVADFNNRNELISAVDALNSTFDGVLTTYENYILPTAWIADHLGLPGLPVATAEACTDKFLMRTLFDTAPEKVSPAFAIVDSKEALLSFAQRYSFPLILKPANLAKSLLVTKNHDVDELMKNYSKSLELIHTTYRKYAPNRTPQLIVEEFLEGSIHSVDAFVDNVGMPHILEQIVDYQTSYDIGYDDNFHYSRLLPSALSTNDQAALRHCADIGIRALGMKSSPAHVEVIMTREGPRIVEIGARNGGYRERMHKLANDIDITGAALALALGTQPSITASKNDPIAVLELFPLVPGIFSGIDHEAELKKLPSLAYFAIKAKKGEFIGKAADGYKMGAVIILHNTDVVQFEKDLSFVNKSVSIKTAS